MLIYISHLQEKKGVCSSFHTYVSTESFCKELSRVVVHQKYSEKITHNNVHRICGTREAINKWYL